MVDSSGWIEVFTNGRQAEHFLALMADNRILCTFGGSLRCSVAKHRTARVFQSCQPRPDESIAQPV
jgi:hypothetical protein